MSSPRFSHPLMGANLHTLLTLFVRNGTGRYPIHLTIILAAAFLRWPFSTYERWQVTRTSLPESAPPPIFIVGHWRSGTTFLNNILSQSPQFACVSPIATGIPWDFLTIGKLMRPLLEKALPKNRFIDRVSVDPDSPQEDEIALASMQLVSFYHGLYFPKNFTQKFNKGIFFEDCSNQEIEAWKWSIQHFCKKLQIEHPDRQVLIKNPVYTARIRRLRQIWPNAKFIHIYRNPYRVYQSMLNFYKKLFPELALQPFDHVPISEIVLQSYPKMMQALLEDSSAIPPENFIEFSFEQFEADPIRLLQKTYDQLDLTGWEQVKPAFQEYVDAQKTYRKNQYAFPKEDIEQVKAHWHPFIQRWGYEPPESAV